MRCLSSLPIPVVGVIDLCHLRRALLQQHGVQIRVLGRRDLLPPDVQASCEEAERMTAHNTRYVPSSSLTDPSSYEASYPPVASSISAVPTRLKKKSLPLSSAPFPPATLAPSSLRTFLPSLSLFFRLVALLVVVLTPFLRFKGRSPPTRSLQISTLRRLPRSIFSSAPRGYDG